MEEKISCCGINCLECEAYKATMANDDAMREEVAKKWASAFNPDIKAKDINCTGCLSDDNIFSFCNSCKLRLCNKSKGTPNCAHCQEYPCQSVNEFRQFNPDGIAKLDAIRQNLGK
ncbi:MAG: DUF3795 domain-containing protein [Caldisericia bacterium]|nr:DUF3795 domain-containing protein [Caldisericia bacterium]